MATSRRKSSSRSAKSRRTAGQGRRTKASNGRGTDAISLLKADHREVEKWFDEFEKARTHARKEDLARKICMALKAHTIIEEEIFYPAFLEATDETDIHHEAEVEHEGAKRIIADIESAGPQDDYFDARVTVLKEMVKHHVNEEEKRGGMFAKAREADMDMAALGEELRRRKDEVMRSGEAGESRRPRRGGQAPAPMLGRGERARPRPHA
jgi:hemerythrin superfamily protein